MSAPSLTTKPNIKRSSQGWRRYLPFLIWMRHYRREQFSGDFLAGVIVAVMLVPQSMAYALLAGLPPQVGLYASIVPLIIYGLLGTSSALAVGPVAIVSLMTAAAIGQLALVGSADYLAFALLLALMLGLIQLLMGVLRIGFLVNFLSHPVLVGFTAAAALVIGASQLKDLLGMPIPRSETIFGTLAYAASHLSEINLATLGLGLASIAVLLYFRDRLAIHLRRAGVASAWLMPLSRGGSLLVVIVATLLVWGLRLDSTAGVSVVGAIPAGLPPLTWPGLDMSRWQALLPTAVTLALVGFMESISVAQSLASKRREKIDANQELIALGAANLGAAFTGGYPVTGGLSRSVVNFNAGANTGLASIITAGLIAVTVLLLTPLFTFLPKVVLAAIVLVAVSTLIDFKAIKHIWQYSRSDAIAVATTFVAVLFFGIESGILIGVAVAIGLFLWHSSRPHIAIVGRLGESGVYRNIERYTVETDPRIVAVRIDESVYFANTRYLEQVLLQIIAERPEVVHLVLIGTAINVIDASGLETLERLDHELRDAGVTLHLAAFKGPVLDRLRAIGFLDQLGPQRLHLSTHAAMQTIGVA